MMLSKNSEKK